MRHLWLFRSRLNGMTIHSTDSDRHKSPWQRRHSDHSCLQGLRNVSRMTKVNSMSYFIKTSSVYSIHSCNPQICYTFKKTIAKMTWDCWPYRFRRCWLASGFNKPKWRHAIDNMSDSHRVWRCLIGFLMHQAKISEMLHPSLGSIANEGMCPAFIFVLRLWQRRHRRGEALDSHITKFHAMK
jgi:hypothetical protein